MIVLFLTVLIIGAYKDAFKDGPQLEAAALGTEDSHAEVEALGETNATNTYRVDKLLYTAPIETPVPTQEPKLYKPDERDVVMIAQLMWGEGRGLESQTEQAAIAWCPLNRVDSTGYGMGHSIRYVVTFPDQFHGYRPWYPTVDDFGRDLKQLAEDVLIRWMKEHDGQADVGRVLPKEYIYFSGDGKHNYFRTEYRGGTRWDWSLPSPYES